MGKYKAHYKAELTINFSVPDDIPGLLPFEELKQMVENNLTNSIENIIYDEIFEPQMEWALILKEYAADVWREDDEESV